MYDTTEHYTSHTCRGQTDNKSIKSEAKCDMQIIDFTIYLAPDELLDIG